ncbi:ferrochelatase [Persephonella hydrogeniphila]|uniref:Ferrochelatase n=1 Tax=Persephonella hydrogeniphila TaxID=198703 RepID=A0A285N332_9AQUI|nr:ferrochelatase [Persephonella hydrogeniphila]SNZ02161.1 ferrochelatase [Persephonella hydrogeniphila]
MAKTGVVLMNMGGPDSLEAIRPFLFNLFSDHNIIRIPRPIQKPVAWLIAKIRAEKTKEYYIKMGGKSPQKEQTLKQAKALQEKLDEDFCVVVAMRYWHPFTEEAVDRLIKEDVQEVILLPLYPHYSKTTTGSSFQEFERVYKQKKLSLPVKKIHSYHNHPLFIKSWVEKIKKDLGENYKEYYFLFSAHSLPEKVIKEGDPYKKQIEESVSLIMENFPDVRYSIAYQSKVSPVKWIEPFTDEEIVRLAREGIKKLCVIPISFVSEHSETLYELDIQYGELAKESGITDYKRVGTLQDEPFFIEALKELVLSEAGR